MLAIDEAIHSYTRVSLSKLHCKMLVQWIPSATRATRIF
jgi:hypothetical protein